MSKPDFGKYWLIIALIVIAVLVVFMQEETKYTPKGLADGVMGYRNGQMFDITFTNGTHVIKSYVVIDNDSNEIVEQDHYLFKIEAFILIGQFETLEDVPQYESFL